MQAAGPEPQHNSEQLFQMLSTLQKQMEDHQIEMIDSMRRSFVKKMLRPVSRHAYSNKSGHSGTIFPYYRRK